MNNSVITYSRPKVGKKKEGNKVNRQLEKYTDKPKGKERMNVKKKKMRMRMRTRKTKRNNQRVIAHCGFL
ncbi:hypothetical protein PP707_08360 [Acetobacter pasteurianus]|nr:hypothetical protein [Acetobacter pasteurianus]